MSQSSSNTVPPVEKWLQSFDAWYSDIEQNHRYQESAHCYFELDETSQPFLNVTIVLTKTPSKRPETDAPATPAPEDEENKSKQSEGSTVDNEPHKRINSESHKLVKLLPTREEVAQGRIVVRLPQAAPPATQAEATVPGDAVQGNKPAPEGRLPDQTIVQDFKSSVGHSFNIDNALAGRSFRIASNSALNQDLLKLLVLDSRPTPSPDITITPAILSPERLWQEPSLQTEGGRYGILLRAALLAKVTGSKANISLFINRLEDLRALFAQAEHLELPLWKKAAIVHSLWMLLEEVQETDPVIPESLLHLPATLRHLLTDTKPLPFQQRWRHVLWYRWNRTLPTRISQHIHLLTRGGHVLAYAAFVSLLLLSVHPSVAPISDALAGLFSTLAHWRATLFPDPAALAITLATAAGLTYALTTHRLTLPEKVALTINDKIETILDSTLADLMKANMDVQIGRLGRGEPPGTTPEGVARKLDEVFSLKELVNSYESTVRARRRHVAEEVGKAQRIRLESHQRLRNAALGVTASFVLLEIGSRIQDHRDIQAGTDTLSYIYWLERRGADGVRPPSSDPSRVPEAMLDCARTEIIEQRPPSPECLDQWRENSLASSSQLLFLVFTISMLIFFVRVMRRND